MADRLRGEDQRRGEPSRWSDVQSPASKFESPSTLNRNAAPNEARREIIGGERRNLVKSRAEAFNQYSSETVSRINEKFGLVPSGLQASVETASPGAPVPTRAVHSDAVHGNFSSPRTLEQGLWETPRVSKAAMTFDPSPSKSPYHDDSVASSAGASPEKALPPVAHASPPGPRGESRAGGESLETALAQIEALGMGLPLGAVPGWAPERGSVLGGALGGPHHSGGPFAADAGQELENEIQRVREKKAVLKESFIKVVGGKLPAGDIATGSSRFSHSDGGVGGAYVPARAASPPSPRTAAAYRDMTGVLKESLASSEACPPAPAERPASPEKDPGGPLEIVVPNRTWAGGQDVCPGRPIDWYQRDVALGARTEVGGGAEVAGLHVVLEVGLRIMPIKASLAHSQGGAGFITKINEDKDACWVKWDSCVEECGWYRCGHEGDYTLRMITKHEQTPFAVTDLIRSSGNTREDLENRVKQHNEDSLLSVDHWFNGLGDLLGL